MAAFLAPVLAITGFHQSAASGAGLIAGMVAAIGVTAVIAHVLERDLDVEAEKALRQSAITGGPLTAAR